MNRDDRLSEIRREGERILRQLESLGSGATGAQPIRRANVHEETTPPETTDAPHDHRLTGGEAF